MFRGLVDMVDGEKLVPFVRLFYEQGDPLMPLLFSLGSTRMVAVQASLLEGERLFAFLDDILRRLCTVQGREVHLFQRQLLEQTSKYSKAKR